MVFPRRSAMLAAALAASLLGAAETAAQTMKLDARLRARRAESSASRFSPAGVAPAAGPRVPVLIRVFPATPLAALRA
ncbi:MAG: hypothetical protein NUW21_07775, partial [Elusimicrobia bacterium]|nr:hypothetical protein [Elusimicrobiota bacterium]